MRMIMVMVMRIMMKVKMIMEMVGRYKDNDDIDNYIDYIHKLTIFTFSLLS